jgi:hypothetical protein
MKYLFSIFLILIVHQTFACKCSHIQLLENVAQSDFIATAKILSLKPDQTNKDFHIIEIKILELYKGKRIKSLKINSVLNSSCAFLTPKNTTWLIFATKNKNGDLSFGMCSGSRQLDVEIDSAKYPLAKENYQKSIDLKLNVLSYLRKNSIVAENDYSLSISFSNDCLKKFNGVKISKDKFALYELTIDKNLKVTKVTPIKEFDNNAIRADLVKCIHENIRFHTYNKTENKKVNKIIICFYYYETERGDPSFISHFDV